MAPSSCIPLMLLALCCLTSAGPLSRSPCELLPVGTGHPVQAILKSFTAMSGCASRGTMSLPQEVHVINLRRRAAESSDSPPVRVELHLKPIQSMSQHQKPLVFVLNSPQPVIWNVNTENLALNITHTFHVQQGSEVHFKQTNFSHSSRIQEETLPQGNEHLLNWAQKKYRAVTSFSELRMTQAIDIKVGEDRLLSDICKIDSKFLSVNYLGSYEEPQMSKGCIVSVPDKNREVHIIELNAPNSSSGFMVDVIVDLRPLKEDGFVLRDVVLVLKCVKSVKWVIKAHNVQGKLDVVASDRVTVSSQMFEKTSSSQHLPSGSQALIKWASDNGYSPVTSYTSTDRANLFNIRLREQDVVDQPDSIWPPELFVLRQTSFLQDREPVQPRSSLPFPFPAHLPISMPNFPDVDPFEQRNLLDVELSVQCEDDRMVVSVEKKSLEAKGFANASLSLKDPECKAKVNATHYTLETSLTGCETTVFPMYNSPMALHINSVTVTSSNETQDYEDVVSADELFRRHGEDVGGIQIEPIPHTALIEFNCSYRKTEEIPKPKPGGALFPPRPPVNDISFKMELSNSLSFNNPVHQGFFVVSDQQQVFVQITSTTTDPDIGLTLTSCFISSSHRSEKPSDYILIETICPVDNSFRWTQNPLKDIHLSSAKTFTFTFNSKRLNEQSIFLHCEISLCSEGSTRNRELPQCLDPYEQCPSLPVDKIFPFMQNANLLTKQMFAYDVICGSQGKSDVDHNDQAEMFLLDTSTVVGIAFAAFVIGALLTGALWFIYTHTGGTARTQPIQKPQPVSQNSSAAHSIGSTQSTPCSSSSTA